MKQVITLNKMRDRGLFCPRLCPGLALLVAWIVLSMLVSACGGATPAPTSAPTEPGLTGTVAPEQDEPAPEGGAPEGEAPQEGAPEGEAPQEDAPELEGEIPSAEGVATAVSARTPIPTPTPGPVAREIEEFAAERGLAGKTFLGLAIEDWINLAVSGLVILIGYFAIRLLVFVLRKIAKGTVPTLDDDVLALIAGTLNWLLLLWVIHFAALRLDFLSDSLRTNLRDMSFLLALGIVTYFAIRLIGLLAQDYRDGIESPGKQRRLTPVIMAVQRLVQSVVLIIAVSILLVHLGFDVSIIAAILIVSGLIISFGAQDILTDFLSGFIILIDQPFRVGDSILIKELDTRGTVLEIGPRSTQIKTGDNREVIVPNSSIGQSQVVNYTYPDPRYRTQTEIGVAYGTDPEEMRKVIVETVRGVEGVLLDRPVDVFYLKFGDSARLVRVRWWIDTYRDEQPMLDRVNAALELALDRAGIELPNNTYDLNVRMPESSTVQSREGSEVQHAHGTPKS